MQCVTNRTANAYIVTSLPQLKCRSVSISSITLTKVQCPVSRLTCSLCTIPENNIECLCSNLSTTRRIVLVNRFRVLLFLSRAYVTMSAANIRAIAFAFATSAGITIRGVDFVMNCAENSPAIGESCGFWMAAILCGSLRTQSGNNCATPLIVVVHDRCSNVLCSLFTRSVDQPMPVLSTESSPIVNC